MEHSPSKFEICDYPQKIALK